MIDTFEAGYGLPGAGSAEQRAFLAAVSGPISAHSDMDADTGELRPISFTGVVEGLGVCRYSVAGRVSFGGSLAKFRQRFAGVPEDALSNDETLTAPEVNETVQRLLERAERAFSWLPPSSLTVHRADICYQRKVKSSMQTLAALQGAMKQTRLGCSWFTNGEGAATGLMLRGGVVAHRVYDKGLEGKNAEYVNVLRSEEQLRRKAKDFAAIYDPQRREFSRAACLEVMNERYLDAGYGQQMDVSELVFSKQPMLALLVLHPELEGQYKQTVSKSSYYEMRKKARLLRASFVPDDLRVPENAWLPV